MEPIQAHQERAVMVGLSKGPSERLRAQESLLELRDLVVSAGAQPVALLFQERPEPDPAFYIGRGKLIQLREAVFDEDADLVVFDDELSPAQQRNLERELEVKVLDRSGLILDIFAQRARSREGKLQVELALLEYRLPRLGGKGVELSRLGGGIGTRGPGETKLEVDRRTVRRRISRTRSHLADLAARRELQRQKRRCVPIPTISLVGYTNAGKSTLFNRLASETTLVSSKMFATLDPLVRRLRLPSGREVLLSDTVGFIRKLPHQLVAAFRATLEETTEADLLLHVIDAADENFPALRTAVNTVLDSIGAAGIPVIEVYNKIDRLEGRVWIDSAWPSVQASALTGEGMEELLGRIDDFTGRDFHQVTLLVPFEQGGVLNQLKSRGEVRATEYLPQGVRVRAALRVSDLGRFSSLITEMETDPDLD